MEKSTENTLPQCTLCGGSMGQFAPNGDHLVCLARLQPKEVGPQEPRRLQPPLDDMPDDIEAYRNFRAEERW